MTFHLSAVSTKRFCALRSKASAVRQDIAAREAARKKLLLAEKRKTGFLPVSEQIGRYKLSTEDKKLGVQSWYMKLHPCSRSCRRRSVNQMEPKGLRKQMTVR